MEFGAHLPLIDFEGHGYSLGELLRFTEAAREAGYALLATNDHLLFAKPWLDGPTALAAVLPEAGGMTLITSVALPVVRGPVQTAKALAAIDLLSEGRLIAGVGPGSSRADYLAVGIEFEERWKRVDDAVRVLRALWRRENYKGPFYSSEGIELLPSPSAAGGPPIWIGSWGSDAGLRRTARLGDGWLASAYNTSPTDFAAARAKLGHLLSEAGKDAGSFPNGIATMWTYVTEERSEADRAVARLAAMLNRDPGDLEAKLAIGGAEHCSGILRAYREAGAQRVLLWPLADAAAQIETFMTRVRPLVDSY